MCTQNYVDLYITDIINMSSYLPVKRVGNLQNEVAVALGKHWATCWLHSAYSRGCMDNPGLPYSSQ